MKVKTLTRMIISDSYISLAFGILMGVILGTLARSNSMPMSNVNEGSRLSGGSTQVAKSTSMICLSEREELAHRMRSSSSLKLEVALLLESAKSNGTLTSSQKREMMMSLYTTIDRLVRLNSYPKKQ